MNGRRREIFFIKKHNGYNTVGTEQGNGRPYLIVTPNELLHKSPGALCVPLTTQEKRPLPQHCKIDCLGKESTVLCEQMRYIDETQFGDYYCTATDEEMAEVEKCLLEAVGISFESFINSNEIVKKLANAEKEISKLTDLLESRDAEMSALSTDVDAKTKAIVDEKDAEIARLQKEIEKLKIQAEAYIGLIKSA